MGDQISKECGCVAYHHDPASEQKFFPTERKEPVFAEGLESTVKRSRSQTLNEIPSRNANVREFRIVSPKKLYIKIIASATLQPNQTLMITSLGLMGSPRQANDGYVYFGSKKRCMKKTGPIVNDFVIKSIDEELGERHRGFHFYIHYDGQKNQYKINDIGNGLGVFRQLQFSHVLRDNQMINCGLLFIIVNTAYGGITQLGYNPEMQDLLSHQSLICMIDGPEGFQSCNVQSFLAFLSRNKNEHWAFLKMSLYGGHSNEQQYLFCTNTSQGTISVGRDPTINLISFPKDKLLSKCQFSIVYDNARGWVLMDSESTNGVWMYINDETTIYEGMKFKANHTVFQVQSIEE